MRRLGIVLRSKPPLTLLLLTFSPYVQTAAMIKISARRPEERRDNIMRWRQSLAYETLDKVAAWGMQVQKNLTEVQARVLQPPKSELQSV